MNIVDYYKKSLFLLKQNPKTIIPIVLGALLIVLVSIIGITAVLFSIIMPELMNSDMNILLSVLFENISLLITAGILILLVLGIIYSFVNAATIGMAKQVVLKEKASLKFAWETGKKYALKIFLVNLIFSIVAILVIVSLSALLMALTGDITTTFIGILTAIFLVILPFTFVGQSIVINENSVIGSIKESFNLFWSNKFKVLAIILILMVISFGLTSLLSLIPTIGSILANLANLIIFPYFTLALTYAYLDLTDKIME